MSVGEKTAELHRTILALEAERDRLKDTVEELVEDIWYKRDELKELKGKVAFEKKMLKAITKDAISVAENAGMVPVGIGAIDDAN